MQKEEVGRKKEENEGEDEERWEDRERGRKILNKKMTECHFQTWEGEKEGSINGRQEGRREGGRERREEKKGVRSYLSIKIMPSWHKTKNL